MVNTNGSPILAPSLTKKIDFPHSYPVQWRKEQGIRRLPLLFRTYLMSLGIAVPKGRT